MRKCTLSEQRQEEEDEKDTSSGLGYSYGHFAEAWYYLLNVSVEGASQLDKVLITWAVMIKVYYVHFSSGCIFLHDISDQGKF